MGWNLTSSVQEHERMFWKLEYKDRFLGSWVSDHAVPHLIVNRAQVSSSECCTCGGDFGAAEGGGRVLSAMVGPQKSIYVFCAACGEFIMARLRSEHLAEHYLWDWAVPLRGSVDPCVRHP